MTICILTIKTNCLFVATLRKMEAVTRKVSACTDIPNLQIISVQLVAIKSLRDAPIMKGVFAN